MGNKFTVCELTRDELTAFMATTHCNDSLCSYFCSAICNSICRFAVNPAEIRGLWFHFKDLSCEDNSNVIDKRYWIILCCSGVVI